MALVNKVGSLIRQTASKRINNELSASNSSIFQIIRCMSSSELIVEGLSSATTNTSLKNAFAPYGHVKGAIVSVGLGSKNARSSPFGLVIYSNTESASAAKKALDQKELYGSVVRVKYLEDKPQKDRDSDARYGSSFLEGFTFGIFDHIYSGKKIEDSDVAGQNVGASDKRNDGGESHNSGVTSGNKNANDDYGDLSSGYFDGEIQNSDPAGEDNDSFFSGWGGGGDDSKGFFSDYFDNDDD